MTPVYELQEAGITQDANCITLRWIYRLEPWLAALALLMLLPLALVIALTIALLSRRSPLIRHARIGWHGCQLPLLKFRTMWPNTPPDQPLKLIEDVSGSIPERKTGGDSRVSSSFAAMCRRYSLDEIPQLYHVMRGQMSFVGPRPITKMELDTYYGPYASEILGLKPGITGLWQVVGRNRLTYSRRRTLDIILVRRASPLLYLRILLRTIPKVVCGDDAY